MCMCLQTEVIEFIQENKHQKYKSKALHGLKRDVLL